MSSIKLYPHRHQQSNIVTSWGQNIQHQAPADQLGSPGITRFSHFCFFFIRPCQDVPMSDYRITLTRMSGKFCFSEMPTLSTTIVISYCYYSLLSSQRVSHSSVDIQSLYCAMQMQEEILEYPRPAARNYLIIFSMFVCDSPDAQTDSLITITPRYSPPNKPIGIKIQNRSCQLHDTLLHCYRNINILNVLIIIRLIKIDHGHKSPIWM